MVSKKHKKVCTNLNYNEHLLILPCTITGCVSTSAFASLVNASAGVSSFAVGLRKCAINEGIKNYTSIIKNKEKTC